MRELFRDYLLEATVEPEAVADFVRQIMTGHLAQLDLQPRRVGVFKGRSSEPSQMTGTISTIYIASSPHISNTWLPQPPSLMALQPQIVAESSRQLPAVTITNDETEMPASRNYLQYAKLKDCAVDISSSEPIFGPEYNLLDKSLQSGLKTPQIVTLGQPATNQGFNEPFIGRVLIYRELLSLQPV